MRPARLRPHAVRHHGNRRFLFQEAADYRERGERECCGERESGGGDHLLLDLLGHGRGGSGKRGRAVPIMDAGAMSPRHFFSSFRGREPPAGSGCWGGDSGVIPYSQLTARQWRGAARVIGTAGCEACRGLARAAPAKTWGKSESDGQQNKYIESGCLAGGETVTAGVVQ